ncbi:MAG: hypothetical protein KJO96_09740, partial [Winogradskyella sp.]|nr:hypothetical protein [Winogradskyella sp.]
MKKVFLTLKAPFKFFLQKPGNPIKFIYNKRNKLLKIISNSNAKIVAVKISTMVKRTIVIAIFIITIITSSGIETQKTSEKSYTFLQNSLIERIFVQGGAIDH